MTKTNQFTLIILAAFVLTNWVAFTLSILAAFAYIAIVDRITPDSRLGVSTPLSCEMSPTQMSVTEPEITGIQKRMDFKDFNRTYLA
jgi:hypothetical protein